MNVLTCLQFFFLENALWLMSMFKQKRLTTYMSRRGLSSSLTDCLAVVMNARSTKTLVVYQYDVVLH